ncbi:MAG: Outer membrane protein P6 precursor [Syntrophorhabdus sp. PtaB.Bin047]|jgi:peptidoglycan-associated lipoprotein|nr:MAG: Outer membrane protein P6 precursor [Syntrophorhabdus sp. PtaB.Bin047]
MRKRYFFLALTVLLAVVSLNGCGCFYQQMKGETPPPAAPPAVVTPPEAKTPVAVAPAAMALKDIHFDFDRYNIREGDAAILRENMGWFRDSANAGKKVRIEGHCDERGTVEYNLVLGQKRADSTKSFLAGLGADPKLLETVSYGKEKPVDPGHNEDAWAKNRRAHFQMMQ